MPADPDTPQTDARTLFVRNVAYDVDAAQLEEVFTDIGPVRQCFLVTDKQQQAAAAAVPQKRHKGIAFVQFAIPEDAERALEELNGKEVAGRRLKIERAHKRATFEERKQKKRQAADEGAEQDADGQAPAAQQQEQPGGKVKKPAAAPAPAALAPAAAGEQPPRKRQKTTQPKQQQQGAPAGTALDKHKWLRTVALGVQSPGVYLHAAQQLAAACGGLVEVLDPAPADVVSKAHLTQDGCSGHVVFLVYENVKAASHAVAQLHGQQLTPATLAAAAAATSDVKSKDKKHKRLGRKEAKRLAKQQQEQQLEQEAAAADGDAAAGITLWARVVSGEGAHVKKWRIILRNLAFQATEPELRKLLSSSGAFVWDLQLPRGADGRVRGFAFASYTSHPEAEKAIKAVNGQMLRKRPVAADWAIAKVQYEGLKGQQQQQQQQLEPAAGSSDEGSDGGSTDGDVGSDGGSGSDIESEGGDSQEGESEEGSEGGSGLSDTDEQESENEIGMESDESDEDDDVSGSGDDESGSEDDVRGSEDDAMGSGSDGEGEQEDADVRAERDAVASALDAVLKQQQQQQQQPQANGVASSKASQQQQQQQQQKGKQQQEAAGDAAGAAAGSSGAVSRTVFVRGLPLDTTSIELQARFDRFGPVKACRIVVDKTTGKPKGTAFIEFKNPEPAAAAAAASARARAGKGPDVTVKGVSLTVDLALTQDDARRLGVEHGRGSTGAAGGPQGSAGPGGKFDRRNLYLSKEGFIEEGSAVWASMSENDRRKRKRAAEEKNQKLKSPNFAVSTTRLAVRNIPVSWDEKKLKAVFIAGVKERATKENPKVVQVKILRDSERPDPSGNPGGRSRGFGFVEFADHSHALAALRQLNNNPKTFGSTERRPIVEFACDNVKVLKMRQDKLQAQKQQRQARKEQQQQDEEGKGHAGDGDVGEEGSEGGEGSDMEGAEDGDAPSAAAAGGQKGKGPGRKGDKQQQQQAEGGEKLTKRQLKRRKDKERRQAKWQQQKQQQNGVAPAAAAGAAGAGAAKKPPQQQQQQRDKKGGAATAAAAAAAAAQAAKLAAKSARQQQQVAAEEAARGQKRRADDYLDRLASLDEPGPQGSRQQQQGGKKQTGPATAAGGDGGSGKKRHKPGRAAEERLEKLVDDYKSKLFGLGGGGTAGQQSQQQQKRSLSRWFE